MKNILAENLLRFGVKNLNEKDKVILSEALLLEQTQQVTAALKSLNDAFKAKPTKIAGVDVYPAISIGFTNNALPAVGMNYPEALAKEIDGMNSNEKYRGKFPGQKLPKTLSVSTMIPNWQTVKDTNFKKYLGQERNRSKSWFFNYGRDSYTTGGLGYKIEDGVKTISDYINNFYVTGANGKWWGANGVNAQPSGTSADFNSAITALLRTCLVYDAGRRPIEPF